jgi:ubiquinone biosynthesis accessory factor UbiJ
MFAHPSVTALNHLLTQNSWALHRLVPFAGMTARFDIAPFSYSYTILGDGFLSSADAAAKADVFCVIAPSLLPRLALNDESAHKEIHSEGDVDLLAEIFFLSRNLRCDIAEDVSVMTGDIAAERIMQTMQSVQQQFRHTVANLARAATEYLTEERPLLIKPRQLSLFIQQVDMLRDDVERLEQRIGRLYAAKKN